MLRLLLGENDPSKLRLLFLGAHCDDIEIGCGATVLRLVRALPGASVRWVVFGSTPQRAEEARRSASEFLAGAKSPEVSVHGFTDSFFPHRHAVEIKDRFEDLKRFEPTVIFTHRRHDLHQDHRFLCELTWNTFRDHFVLEYEVPKYDGDLGAGGAPNFFIPIDRAELDEKSRLIRKHFLSQSVKHWFDEEVFAGLARIRGVECRSPTGYAEAFDARKVVF